MTARFRLWWQKNKQLLTIATRYSSSVSSRLARFRLWWQQIKQHPVIVAGIIVVIFALIAFTFAVIKFGWDWTGFTSGESNRVIVNTSTGTTTAEVVQPTKTLWDWLGLLGVLAIPVVVGFGALWFTTKQRQVSEAENKDNQRETALQVYIDKMSELLLDKDNPLLDKDNPLRVSKPEDEKQRIVARARTLNVLRQLNSERKGYVIQFLYESHLLSKRIIDLSFAELSEANLYRASLYNANLFSAGLFKANLVQANLSLANLSEAYLVKADLRGAKLCYADLRNANLQGADLRGADLSKAVWDEKVKLKGAFYNKKKIQMRSPQGEEPLSLESTQFPDGFNCERAKMIYVDCFGYDKPEVCQKVKEDQSITPDTKRDW